MERGSPGECTAVSALVRELLRTGLYKRSQGRICRQATFAVIAIIVGWGLYALNGWLVTMEMGARYGLIGVLFLAGLWFAYRIVNLPAFADFLIAVEAEMNKVSWPTRAELFRGSAVVLVMIIALAAVLYVFDLLWGIVFQTLGIV
ncbi:MAG: preprotein translocase subunit SecE [Pirellulales bacterium]|nr:preprotein translocase subunit SecE [Pirellulales bacterium]